MPSWRKNPYGVPISRGTWGGSGGAAAFAVHMYYLHQAFPDLVGIDDTLRGFDYVLGRIRPTTSRTFRSVGTSSKLVAYGNNRADYTFIPGGMIPGRGDHSARLPRTEGQLAVSVVRE